MRRRAVTLACAAILLLLVCAAVEAEGAYTIKEGETLSAISRRSGVPVGVLTVFNGIADPGRLKVGTVIRVPGVYTVVKGDTLYAISRRWSVAVEQILVLNGLNQDSLIKPGQKLYVPANAVSGSGQGTSSAQAAQGQDTGGQTGTNRQAVPAPAIQVVWPHPGARTTEKGKLWWLIFQGASGDVVRSATEGEVKWAATWWGYGKVVIVRSPDGRNLVYGGNRELLVKVGDRVFPGTEIARLGESLPGGGTRLYFGVNDPAGKMEDPEKFFSASSQS